ncbi:MAG TPA: HDIG domain-containing protein [Methanocorpusculum sp.]|nr:HDIG domain-containing protein [Methanocorpusculum sp.]HJJ91015.1 HDIG domain-containing protein [Methanocorpusculum sp.]
MHKNEYFPILFSVGCDIGVIQHCKVVSDVASQFSGESVNNALVFAGSMMHDIGRSVTHDISHAQEGTRICRTLGKSEELAQIVLRHTGAGLDVDECTLLGLIPQDCVPKTLEEKIVAHADNLVKGSRIISIEERMMLIAELAGRTKKRIWRLAMEIEILRI